MDCRDTAPLIGGPLNRGFTVIKAGAGQETGGEGAASPLSPALDKTTENRHATQVKHTPDTNTIV